MSTRSRIGIEQEDGTVRSIYCHFDGSPDHHLPILQEHYKDREKVEKLIQLGDISYLAPEVEIPEGSNHSFENKDYGIVCAYHRDRGEDYHEPNVDPSANAYFRGDIEEWGYLFTKDGEWVYRKG
jgi:hypothetical protein